MYIRRELSSHLMRDASWSDDPQAAWARKPSLSPVSELTELFKLSRWVVWLFCPAELWPRAHSKAEANAADRIAAQSNTQQKRNAGRQEQSIRAINKSSQQESTWARGGCCYSYDNVLEYVFIVYVQTCTSWALASLLRLSYWWRHVGGRSTSINQPRAGVLSWPS